MAVMIGVGKGDRKPKPLPAENTIKTSHYLGSLSIF